MTRLHDLYRVGGQSPWIDDLKRSYVTKGELAALVDLGIRGVTSNPTIMAKAIEAGSDYDEQFSDVIRGGSSVEDAYWDLVIDDVTKATGVLRPVYDDAHGGDGFVSIEVGPGLANDTAATISAARDLHTRIDRPNLLVKIPATRAGIPAIEEMIAEGRSVNVTLIFSLERYDAVIEAYVRGLERFVAGGGDPTPVASVASFFVSRVDTEVDRRLDDIAEHAEGARRERAQSHKGKAALAQARLAFELFTARFAGPRFVELQAKGARLQRPLWASTSTKNPAYPDLLYVDGLIGPDTVDTMPGATVEAFLDHGVIERTVDRDLDAAHADLDALAEIGVDMAAVTAQLEEEGVTSFTKSFDEVLESLGDKANALGVR